MDRPDSAGRPSRRPAAVGAGIAASTVAAGLGAALLALSNARAVPAVDQELWNLLPATVPFGVVGGLVVARRPRNPVGWLFAVTGFGFTLQQFLGHYAFAAVVARPGSLPGADAALWVALWLPAPALVAAFLLLPLYFPDGRLASRRWRPLVWAAVGWLVLTVVGTGFRPGAEHVPVPGPGLRNPWGIDAVAPLAPLVEQSGAVWLALAALAAASLVPRYRRAAGDERAQIKWLAYATAVVVALFVAALAVPALDPVATLAPVLIPLAAAVAILRHGLYDVDRVINRTLVYAVLSACVVGIYVAVVAALGAVVPAGGNLAVSLVATGLVAVAFAPLRTRLQQLVNRLLYGHRDDPYRALALLGRRLEAALAPEAVPAVVASTVAEALRSPWVAVEVRRDGVPVTVAVHGRRRDADATPPLELPLTSGGEEVGRLRIAPRRPREGFSAADRRLLADLARQVGSALHTVRLTDQALRLSADLQRSRHRLVTAREEERRRLGREIHDGFGPQLAGVSMKIEAARELIAAHPRRAEELLAALLEQTEHTVEDLRRMSHGLRPPALDALGLLGAVRAHAEAQRAVRVRVEAPEAMAALPAAVEIAAYRIVLEALHNVVRHAGATACTVTLAPGPDGLLVEVTDDGRGIAHGAPPGLGLHSMRERAEELGGRCAVGPRPGGGTLVRAVLPCLAPESLQEA